MKKVNKFFYALLAFAAVGMVSCSTDAPSYEPGPQEVSGCHDVYFSDPEVLAVKELVQGPIGDVSVDPSEATVYTYYVDRGIPEDGVLPAITVPVKVVTNTKEAFTFTEIAFAEGEDRTTFEVTLSEEAEVGVPYTLSLAIEDPQYVKQYESTNSTSLKVTITRVKWIDVGECDYTEDILTGWWGFGFDPEHPTYKVKVQVRSDSINQEAFDAALAGTGSDAGLSGVYRLVNPYRVGPWADPEDTTLESNPTYMIINANPYNRAYIDLQPLGISINGGEASVYSMVALRLDNGVEPSEDMYGSFKNGTLTFPVQALLGCPGGSYVGQNNYYANNSGLFSLVVAPALGKYELVLPVGYEDGDFEFEEVELPENAMFYSESQSATYYPILEKGKIITTTDDADRDFVATYGWLYRLGDLYEVDYPIYFAAKDDGTVTLPEQYIEQATGLTQNGYDVMMAIDTAASKFDPSTGLLNLVAEFYSYQGDYGVSYGVYNEVISVELPEFPVTPVVDLKADFTYAPLFTDTFTSTFQAGEWDATLEQGACLNYEGAEAFAKQYGTAYRIPAPYAQGYDLYFTANEKGEVSVPTGYELQNSGTTIYGKDAYISIRKGTMAKNGVTLTVAICDAEGEALMPYACTEKLVTYTWTETGVTGSYISALNEAPTAGCTLEKAEEGDIYRITNWLDTGKHLMFTWDKTTNKCEVMGFNKTGIDAALFGGFGEIEVCDVRTFYAWIGYDVTWDALAAEFGGDVQPRYVDELQISETESAPAIVFYNYYAAPAMGVGFSLGDFYMEAFVLDAPLVEEKWEDVAVGVFTHTTDFYAPQEYLPYQEELKLQRLGTSNKYQIVGAGAGAYNIALTFDEATGAVTVPGTKTGLTYEETDGSLTDIYSGDAYAMLSDWGVTDNSGAPLTPEVVYSVYPNSYDAATKTFSFYLGYYDLLGYTYTTVSGGDPTLHTFQITGEATAQPASAPMIKSLAPKKVKSALAEKYQTGKRQYKQLAAPAVKIQPKSYKKEVRSMKNATPVPYSRIKEAKF